MSTKELKVKRTKLVWYRDTTNWDEFPLIILAKAIRKQAWFKGGTILLYRDIPIAEGKKKFRIEPEDWNTPNRLFLIQTYKDTKIRVEIDWIFGETRCSILLEHPTSDEFYPNGHGLAPKPTKSRYVEGALERIEEAFTTACPIIDEKIEDKRIEEKERQAAIKYHKNLCDELGVEMKKKFSKYTPLYEYAYRQGKHFGIEFDKREDSDTFRISSIDGHFTLTEIKQLIKFIGGCPSAVASRLTGKKG